MKKTVPDSMQLSLDLDAIIEITRPVNPTPASMDYSQELRHMLSGALKECVDDRFTVAAKMSSLTGHEISKSTLDSWCAESREGWRFPLEYATAFEVAVGTYCLTEFMARKRGCRVYVGDEVRQAEMGRIEAQIGELAAKLKALKKSRITG